MITKKKRSLKRVYRVKSRGRSHVKTRSRGRVRVSKRSMRGGLGVHDGANIGITNRFRFEDPRNIDEFATFIFGCESQKTAWINLLEECLKCEVPVYILTSGNKVGIIRTLQLLNMDHYFKEVLCTNTGEPTEWSLASVESPIEVEKLRMSAALVNPENILGYHNFRGLRKYDVIHQILTELEISPNGTINGCFLDDDINNRDVERKVLTVEFIHTGPYRTLKSNNTPNEKPEDFSPESFINNKFYRLYKQTICQIIRHSQYNFTPSYMIDEVKTKVQKGEYKIVFLDFDKTFQTFNGAFPFQNSTWQKWFSNHVCKIIIE